jgi:hypothetical protein
VVQMFGTLLGRAAGHRIATDGEAHLRHAGEFACVLIAFAAGGAAGFVVDGVWPAASILIAAVVVYALAFTAAVGGVRADPTQNGPTP